MKNILLLIVFLFPTLTYSQIQIGLDIDGESAGDNSGASVSMPDAYTVAIGAQQNEGSGICAGHVRIYKWNGIAWVQKGIDIDGEAYCDWSGKSVSMPDSTTVAIGAPYNSGHGNNAGHVRIYDWNGMAWIQKGIDIDGEAEDDKSGWSVSMPDANTLAIGAYGNIGNGNHAGHVRIYMWNGTAWVQKGMDIDGEAAGDWSGFSLSMPDASTVGIGAPDNNGNGSGAGHVRIYEWNGSAWVQKGLDIDGQAAFNRFGESVSMPDANTLAIGAPINDGNGIDAGQVRIYDWNGIEWVQRGIDLDGEAEDDRSGASVSMPDANTVAIGAPKNDGNGIEAGHVKIYAWNGIAWVQRGIDLDGESAGDYSGSSVSMPDAATVSIGAHRNNDNGIYAGHIRVYSLCGTTQTMSVCDSLVSPSGNYTWTASGTYMDTIPNEGYCDFVMTFNLTVNTNTTIIDTHEACDSFTWIDGNTYTSSNSIATHTLTNVAGCDSVITLNLTINSIDNSTSNFEATITANQTGATYQWIDCNNGNSIISGETNSSYTATANGDYAVIITLNGCSDTSNCVNISTIGLDERSLLNQIKLFPNPVQNTLTIQGNLANMNFKLMDTTGKTVELKVLEQNTNSAIISMDELPSGVYFIEIYSENNSIKRKIVKQ